MRSTWARHQHGSSASASKPARLPAARRPDVQNPLADLAAGVVDEEATVVLPPDVQLQVSAEREQLRVGRDDSLADVAVPARQSLKTVRGELHGNGLAGAQGPGASHRPVAFRAAD